MKLGAHVATSGGLGKANLDILKGIREELGLPA